jgi:tRNA (guanosine-2'-O-)-methyltransferase
VARSVARGAEKWVDIVRHKQPPSVLSWAREHGMPLVGAHPEGELAPEQLASLPRVALVLGNEHQGIREEIARACTARVRVPMRGFVESLNMSVTAAVLLYAATLGRPGDLDLASQRRLYARGLYLTIPKAEEVLAHAAG